MLGASFVGELKLSETPTELYLDDDNIDLDVIPYGIDQS